MFIPPRKYWPIAGAGLGLAIVLVLPWWRNHRVLVDFFDYGLVMSAVGRMQLGDRPYVDFVTPIQTLQFDLAWLAERIAGPRYLSLTYAALLYTLAAFTALALLLRRLVGPMLALLVAAAVVMATASQHTIVWYNAMGVVWLSIVAWITAREPEPSSQGSHWRIACVWLCLWLGGMTKLTFQITALAFAITLTLRSASIGAVSWRIARQRLYSFLGFGIVAPIATELLITGATLQQWLTNVVVLPAQFRTGMLVQLVSPRFYLHTPHDYYPPLFLPFAGAWGVAVLGVITGIIIVERISKPQPTLAREWLWLGILTTGALVCSAVLLATNMDIAYVSAAVPLVLGLAIAHAFRSLDADRSGRVMRVVISVSALSLALPSWFSAWAGARALWGHEPLVRRALVSTNDLSPRFKYLRGMKILPTLHTDLAALETKLQEFSANKIPFRALYFTHATEWMVRAVPEARHAGLPLWLARGTTLSDSDAWEIADHLEQAGIRVVFSYEGWNYWSDGLKEWLRLKFEEIPLGQRLHVYQHREPPNPIRFAAVTHSNVDSQQLRVTGGPVDVDVMSDGLFYYGGRFPHRIDLEAPLFRLDGELVVELASSAVKPATAVFRIFAREGNRLTDILWDETITVAPTMRRVTRPFSISTGGRRVSFTVKRSGDSSATFGWRKLQTVHSGPLSPTLPGPTDPRLESSLENSALAMAVFNDSTHTIKEVKAFGAFVRSGESDVAAACPSEIWFRMEGPATHLAGKFRLMRSVTAGSASQAESGQRITVVIYKSGRFDLRYDREFSATDQTTNEFQNFETWLPEGGGWVGLIVSPLSGKTPDVEHVIWRQVRTW